MHDIYTYAHFLVATQQLPG